MTAKHPITHIFFFSFPHYICKESTQFGLTFFYHFPFRPSIHAANVKKMRQKHSDFPVVSTKFLTDTDLGTKMVRFFITLPEKQKKGFTVLSNFVYWQQHFSTLPPGLDNCMCVLTISAYQKNYSLPAAVLKAKKKGAAAS